MKNKLITVYLTSIVMFTLSGILMFNNSKTKNSNEIQYLDFSKNPVYIYPNKKINSKK